MRYIVCGAAPFCRLIHIEHTCQPNVRDLNHHEQWHYFVGVTNGRRSATFRLCVFVFNSTSLWVKGANEIFSAYLLVAGRVWGDVWHSVALFILINQLYSRYSIDNSIFIFMVVWKEKQHDSKCWYYIIILFLKLSGWKKRSSPDFYNKKPGRYFWCDVVYLQNETREALVAWTD